MLYHDSLKILIRWTHNDNNNNNGNTRAPLLLNDFYMCVKTFFCM